MPRPRFQPDPAQRRLIAGVTRAAQRNRDADRAFTAAIAAAKAGGVPIEHIAPAAGVTVKTVYARLARIANRESDGVSGI